MRSNSLFVHGGLLLLASGLAYAGFTKSAPASGSQRLEVQVYSGTPAQLERVEFSTENRTVSLVAKSDKAGRYFVGELSRQKPAPHVAKRADAGAPPPAPPPETEKLTFVAVSSMDKLAEQLAPLSAYRSLGKLQDAQLAEFGFDKPEGKLTITLAGKVHSLILGGTTPGGADRYVKDQTSGIAYAILGNISRDLENADSRLTERSLHAFEPEQVTRVRISAGEQTRELVPLAGNKSAWAGADTPSQEDETASNWMVKLGRLRPNKYVGEAPVSGSTPVVVVEYFEGKQRIGELQLVRGAVLPGAAGDPSAPGADAKYDYYVRTAHTRWYASVIRSSGEQLDQDLGSVLR